MAMSCSCKACQKELEDDLTAYGMNLMNPPSSTDQLLKLLGKVESSLVMVDQGPSDSTRNALQPLMKALIRNELLKHTNDDVKVSVVFCITELSRITAPKHPYDDHKQMEEIFRHTVTVLKKLSDVSSRSYSKVVQILDTVAKLRAGVMLLDLEYDTLVIDIFKIFLQVVRPYHPHNVFTRMKEIMIQLIEDSDELSVELLRPLLDSVTYKNQIASPISSKLGEKVLEHCAVIVKPHLAEALKSMSLNPDACAEIVASICKMRNGKEMMANENAPDAAHPVKVGPSEAKFCEPALQDDTHGEKLKDTCRTNIMTPDNPEDVQPAPNAEVSSGSNELTGKSDQHSSPSENRIISTGSHGHWDQPKDTESPINEDDVLGVPVPTGDVLQSQGQKKDSLHLDLTWGERTKRTLCGKRKPVRDSRKNESASDCDTEIRSESSTKNEEGNIKEHKEPLLQQIGEMKQQTNKITIKMHNIEESGDKATKLSVSDENHLNKCANYKSGRKLATRKHEVKYVDGHVEKLNLQKERWEMLDNNSSQKMANENAPGTVPPVKVGSSKAKFCEPVLQDDSQVEKLKDAYRTNIVKRNNLEDVQPETNAEVVSTRRNKLTGSSGQHSSGSKSPDISRGSHGHRGQPKKNDNPTSEDHLDMLVAAGDVPESQVEKKGSLHLGCTGGEKNKHTVCTKRKPGRDSRKNEFASNCEAECKTEFSIEGEEVTLQQIRGMKQRKKKADIKIYDLDESGEKTTQLSIRDETHLDNCANYKPREKLITGKNEDSKRPRTNKGCGKELVGARIKIWWPLDEKFYEAAVSSFDPVTKKHKVVYIDGDVERLKLCKERWEILEDVSSQKGSNTIKYYGEELIGARIKIWWPLDETFYKASVSSFDPEKRKHTLKYDDGEIEKLRLHKERWEILEDNSSQKDHGLEFKGHAVSYAMSSKKKAKRNSSTEPNVSSSKRSKSTTM